MAARKSTNRRPTRAEVVRYIKSNPNRYPLGISGRGRDAFRDTAGTGYKIGVGQISELSERNTLRNSSQRSAARAFRYSNALARRVDRATGVSRMRSTTNATRMQQMADAIYVFGYAT